MEELTPAEEIIAEQTEILHALRRYYRDLYRVDIVPLNPDDYYDQQLDRRDYREPKDESRRQAAKEAGVSLPLRIRALLSETARSELNERKAAADARQIVLAEEHAAMVEEHRAYFLQQQNQYNEMIDERKRMYLNGDPDEVMAYFEDVLLGDRFMIEFAEQPPLYKSCARAISYDPGKKSLCIRYRVPNADEICTIKSFTYNEKEWAVETKELPAQNAHRVRTDVLHAIIVRTAALVFYSDTYHLVDSLTITGYLDYFDRAYGTNQTVDVLKTTISEEEFLKVDLERARLEDLFARLFKTDVSTGLYRKEPYELKGVA